MHDEAPDKSSRDRVIMQDMDVDLPPLTHEALNWVIRLTSGSATQADAREFEAWRDQSPEHAEAMHAAASLRRTLRAMPLGAGSTGWDNVVPFATPVRTGAISRRTMLAGGGAIAASAAMLAVSPPFGLWPSLAEWNAGERTAIGERRTLHIATGVTLEMNGRTSVSLDAQNNGARLITGEAFASVASDAHPLLIHAGDEKWTVHDAQANISTSDRQTCITCIRGRLTRRDNSVTLRSGQKYVAMAGSAPHIVQVDPDQGSNWRRGVLLFRQSPLAEVVEDINRYREGTIIIADAKLATRPVSGMFHTDKIENAPRQLQQLLGMKVSELPGKVVVFS